MAQHNPWLLAVVPVWAIVTMTTIWQECPLEWTASLCFTLVVFHRTWSSVGAVALTALGTFILSTDIIFFLLVPYSVTSVMASTFVCVFIIAFVVGQYTSHGTLAPRPAHLAQAALIVGLVWLRFRAFNPFSHTVQPPIQMAPFAAHSAAFGLFYSLWSIMSFFYNNLYQLSWVFGIEFPDAPKVAVKDISGTYIKISWHINPSLDDCATPWSVQSTSRHAAKSTQIASPPKTQQWHHLTGILRLRSKHAARSCSAASYVVELNGVVVGHIPGDQTCATIEGLVHDAQYRIRVWSLSESKRSRTPSNTLRVKTGSKHHRHSIQQADTYKDESVGHLRLSATLSSLECDRLSRSRFLIMDMARPSPPNEPCIKAQSCSKVQQTLPADTDAYNNAIKEIVQVEGLDRQADSLCVEQQAKQVQESTTASAISPFKSSVNQPATGLQQSELYGSQRVHQLVHTQEFQLEPCTLPIVATASTATAKSAFFGQSHGRSSTSFEEADAPYAADALRMIADQPRSESASAAEPLSMTPSESIVPSTSKSQPSSRTVLVRELKQLVAQNRQLLDSVSTNTASIADEETRLRASLASLKEAKRLSDLRRAEQRVRMKQLDEAKRESDSAKSKVDRDLQLLKRDNDRLRQEGSALQAECADYNAQINEIEKMSSSQINSHRCETARLEEQVAELRCGLESLFQERDIGKAAVARLASLDHSHKTDLADIEQQTSSLMLDIQKLQQQKQHQGEQTHHLRAVLSELQSKQVASQAELREESRLKAIVLQQLSSAKRNVERKRMILPPTYSSDLWNQGQTAFSVSNSLQMASMIPPGFKMPPHDPFFGHSYGHHVSQVAPPQSLFRSQSQQMRLARQAFDSPLNQTDYARSQPSPISGQQSQSQHPGHVASSAFSLGLSLNLTDGHALLTPSSAPASHLGNSAGTIGSARAGRRMMGVPDHDTPPSGIHSSNPERQSLLSILALPRPEPSAATDKSLHSSRPIDDMHLEAGQLQMQDAIEGTGVDASAVSSGQFSPFSSSLSAAALGAPLLAELNGL
ncbi:hypothetical protein BC831DRAFT_504911 [Entophlyctis helioformis]|nr:hypothetical protein BC831DRAFT_504911 [Entophlyctis helioformis]